MTMVYIPVFSGPNDHTIAGWLEVDANTFLASIVGGQTQVTILNGQTVMLGQVVQYRDQVDPRPYYAVVASGPSMLSIAQGAANFLAYGKEVRSDQEWVETGMGQHKNEVWMEQTVVNRKLYS